MRCTFALLGFLATAAAIAQEPPLSQLPTGAAALEPSAGTTSFRFVVAGDNRPASKCDGLTAPLVAIVQDLVAKPPAFVLWDGDTIYGKDVKRSPDQYTQFLGAFAKLPSPVFNAPGNHEMTLPANSCDIDGKTERIDEPDPSGGLSAIYTKMMAQEYGVFRYGNSAFIAINTDDRIDFNFQTNCQYNGYIGEAQIAALTSTLASLSADADVQHIFVFMHRPIHDPTDSAIGPLGGDGTTPYAQRLDQFLNVFKNAGVQYPKLDVVFASHHHLLYVYPKPEHAKGPFTLPKNGPLYIVTGGAGAPLSGCKKGKLKKGAFYHYLTVEVDGAKVKVKVKEIDITPVCPPAASHCQLARPEPARNAAQREM
ncbi:MAG TPA: metallophosphoesterase [Thermoanaerobaculia bacterium]|nr:metallophosphoesterase [Thermoanaerobaculia bacterium]